MKKLIVIVPSNLRNNDDICRLMETQVVNENVYVIFINQSDDKTSLMEFFRNRLCVIDEIFTQGVVPLSIARNIGLDYLYKKKNITPDSLVMFVDDDAWFPSETINYLLHEDIKGISLKTIDPIQNKSFKKVKKRKGEITGYHLIRDIVSICLVIPYEYLASKPYFNTRLGLGNNISQGEESLFIYELHKKGFPIYYDEHLIYHPYKRTFNMKNYYSMSYFWSLGLFHISKMFLIPTIMYLGKYTVALLLIVKDRRYGTISKNVWIGFWNGMKDTENILEVKNGKNINSKTS